MIHEPSRSCRSCIREATDRNRDCHCMSRVWCGNGMRGWKRWWSKWERASVRGRGVEEALSTRASSPPQEVHVVTTFHEIRDNKETEAALGFDPEGNSKSYSRIRRNNICWGLKRWQIWREGVEIRVGGRMSSSECRSCAKETKLKMRVFCTSKHVQARIQRIDLGVGAASEDFMLWLYMLRLINFTNCCIYHFIHLIFYLL